jgi:hypothetical protein
VDQNFRIMLEAIKHTAETLIRANEGTKETNEAILEANEGIKRTADAALAARDEHEDLRETVGRLETLVIAQSADIRALRDELRRRPNG